MTLKLNYRGEEIEYDDDGELAVGRWVVSDGFSRNHGLSTEKLDPAFRQYISWRPSTEGAPNIGRAGCCAAYKLEFTRAELLDLIGELPEDAKIVYRHDEEGDSSWSFYTYRELAEEERDLVRVAVAQRKVAGEEADRKQFDKLLERHPEWRQ